MCGTVRQQVDQPQPQRLQREVLVETFRSAHSVNPELPELRLPVIEAGPGPPLTGPRSHIGSGALRCAPRLLRVDNLLLYESKDGFKLFVK